MKKSPREEGEDRLTEPQVESDSESFGTWLRRQREVREIDLREIADSSKIGLAYLQAFEEDRFDMLPAPVFAKGFLRQYARYVGLDSEEVVNFYLTACQNAQGEEEPFEADQNVDSSGSTARYLWLALLIVALLAAVVWGLSRLDAQKRAIEEGSSSTPGQAESTTTSQSVDRQPSAAKSATESVPESTAATPRITDGTPSTEPASAPGAAGVENAVGGSESAPETDTASTGAVPLIDLDNSSAPLRVSLDFAGECWIEASIDGVKRIAEIKVQGESLLLEATDRIDLKVGDVNSVKIEVNGHALPIEQAADATVRSLRIDLDTARALAEGNSQEQVG